ncbi:hypothetical protein [Pseudoalteromonas sp. 31A1]|uniref:hypothetical protein n=1 Tax=Pseudoalteromonas sp. 31A1 TaxID=2686351 RepID=UPI0013FDAEF4|nr:hypothetical protein [Pseudoalteromonas sp. 31A1]
MYLLLSGEGVGDIGVCKLPADRCERNDFSEGPMTLIIDQLIGIFLGYEMSHLETERVSYVSKAYLKSNKLPPMKKAMSLKGKKKPPETKYYFENARILASIAKTKSIEVDDKVVAILFRDSDGTASAGRGDWVDKRNSMIQGFRAETFDLGVPMVPKPKSEGWLLCATKDNTYKDCEALEDESGNDDSGRESLKDQLAASLDGDINRDSLNKLIIEKVIDIEKIDMSSFNIFKEDLQNAVGLAIKK